MVQSAAYRCLLTMQSNQVTQTACMQPATRMYPHEGARHLPNVKIAEWKIQKAATTAANTHGSIKRHRPGSRHQCMIQNPASSRRYTSPAGKQMQTCSRLTSHQHTKNSNSASSPLTKASAKAGTSAQTPSPHDTAWHRFTGHMARWITATHRSTTGHRPQHRRGSLLTACW
jgi:hypothetical protein